MVMFGGTMFDVLMQLAQRFWNSHAMINMSVWLRTEQPSLKSTLSSKLGVGPAINPRLTQVRVVIGCPREELGGTLPLYASLSLVLFGLCFIAPLHLSLPLLLTSSSLHLSLCHSLLL